MALERTNGFEFDIGEEVHVRPSDTTGANAWEFGEVGARAEYADVEEPLYWIDTNPEDEYSAGLWVSESRLTRDKPQ